jgi:hypothetical protein
VNASEVLVNLRPLKPLDSAFQRTLVFLRQSAKGCHSARNDESSTGPGIQGL